MCQSLAAEYKGPGTERQHVGIQYHGIRHPRLGRCRRQRDPDVAERQEVPERQALQDPLGRTKYDPFKTVSVTLKGRKIATVHKGKYVIATIDLKGMPKGAFTVKIKATTVLKHHLSASRTYHTCIAKIRPKKKSKK